MGRSTSRTPPGRRLSVIAFLLWLAAAQLAALIATFELARVWLE